MNTRRFTILHSNDMHGNFLAEVCGEKGEVIGGLSLLSGYINKVRQEEEKVIYVIAGDMVLLFGYLPQPCELDSHPILGHRLKSAKQDIEK